MHMDSVVAIDIGGTTIKSAIASIPTSLADAQIDQVRRTPTPIGSVDALVDAVVEIVRSYPAPIAGVGVVMPGVLDVPAGRVRAAGNMQLFEVPIVAPLEDALGLPVTFEHDVRAGAHAELHAGAARGLRDAIFMPIGTGIAAAFIIDGEVRSADGYMGEVGHAHVGPEVACVCGLHGCLEAVASASALTRRYEQRTGITDDAAGVIARASSADTVAMEIWGDALAGLIHACTWMTNLLGSEAIILGGGMSRAGATLFEPLRKGVAASLSFQRMPRLLAATHGDDAGCLGAAILALKAGGVA